MSDDTKRGSQANAGTTAAISVLTAGMAFAAGAGLMYFLDPDLGTGRRTRMLDQLGGTARRAARRGSGVSEDITQELQAVPHELQYRSSDEKPTDDILVERVRSELGHQVRHAGGIEVRATNGTVTLSGPVLADEMAGVLAAVATIPGVKDVDDRLEVHQSAGSVPSLQG